MLLALSFIAAAHAAQPSVGVLQERGQPLCAATLVGEGVAMTAAHCVDGATPELLSLNFGEDASAPQERWAVQSVELHPGYDRSSRADDLALVVLEDVPDRPILEPALLSDEPHAAHALVMGVDYGLNAGGFGRGGEQRAATLLMDEAGGGLALQSDVSRACELDSGAPILLLGEGEPQLLGVASYESGDCAAGRPITAAEAWPVAPERSTDAVAEAL